MQTQLFTSSASAVLRDSDAESCRAAAGKPHPSRLSCKNRSPASRGAGSSGVWVARKHLGAKSPMPAAVLDCALPCSCFFFPELSISFEAGLSARRLFWKCAVLPEMRQHTAHRACPGSGVPSQPCPAKGGTTAGDGRNFAPGDKSRDVPASHLLSSASQPW